MTTVVVEGLEWKEFPIEWTDSDTGRVYSTNIFAISRDHAACVLEDIRSSARLGFGEVVGKYES